MRSPTLLLCLALAGCAGANADVTGSTPDAPRASAHATSPLARAAQAQASGKEDWWKEGGVTREKINAMCWMKFEQGRNDMPVEKRADLVNVCVAKTLKENPIR
ncbi:MAG: hypothetical protein NTV56_19570 [Alphaproteobacteria bacterium]|nr:hypothetical protein [Alphaproteobacteria bacterium]